MCWSCGNVFCQVIDEIYRVLRYVNSTRAPQRAHEVLQELRDISSMAMEYFDEKIVPILKKKLPGADLSGRLIGSAPGNGHLKQKTYSSQYFVLNKTTRVSKNGSICSFNHSLNRKKLLWQNTQTYMA